MSDLTTFRDHCRAMAEARHKPECALRRGGYWQDIHPNPGCNGCNTETDRALFRQLADETDAYIDATHQLDLFEGSA